MANVGIYDMTDTWNNAGTAFTAIKMNVTDTASASGSKLLDIQKGGSSLLVVDKSGNMDIGGTLDVTGATTLDSTLTVSGTASVVEKLTVNHSGSDTFATIQGPQFRDLRVDIDANADSDSFVVRDMRSGSTDRFSVEAGGNVRVATGDLIIPDKIVHTGDANTAIRFPAADTVTVETAGSEALRIASSGGVSIGTTTDAGANNLKVAGRAESTEYLQQTTEKTKYQIVSKALHDVSNGGATAVFDFSKGSTSAGSLVYSGMSGNIKISVTTRISGGYQLVAYVEVPFVVFCLGNGNITLSLGTPIEIEAYNNSGTSMTYTLALSSASNTAATLDLTVTGTIGVLNNDINVVLDGVASAYADFALLTATPA